MSTMNPTLARYYNNQQSNRKIPEKEGVMIEKVSRSMPTIFATFFIHASLN